jgi:hypothetical protein
MAPKRHTIKQKPGPVKQPDDAPMDYQSDYRPILASKMQETKRFTGPEFPGVAEEPDMHAEVPVPEIDVSLIREDGTPLYRKNIESPVIEVASDDQDAY